MAELLGIFSGLRKVPELPSVSVVDPPTTALPEVPSPQMTLGDTSLVKQAASAEDITGMGMLDILSQVSRQFEARRGPLAALTSAAISDASPKAPPPESIVPPPFSGGDFPLPLPTGTGQPVQPFDKIVPDIPSVPVGPETIGFPEVPRPEMTNTDNTLVRLLAQAAGSGEHPSIQNVNSKLGGIMSEVGRQYQLRRGSVPAIASTVISEQGEKLKIPQVEESAVPHRGGGDFPLPLPTGDGMIKREPLPPMSSADRNFLVTKLDGMGVPPAQVMQILGEAQDQQKLGLMTGSEAVTYAPQNLDITPATDPPGLFNKTDAFPSGKVNWPKFGELQARQDFAEVMRVSPEHREKMLERMLAQGFRIEGL